MSNAVIVSCLTVILGSAAAVAADGSSCFESSKLTASDGTADDRFGEAMALHGDLLVVGAALDDDAGDDSGSAYVLRRAGAKWVEEQKLIASDGRVDGWFGAAVATDGTLVVVGATIDSTRGAVHVFGRDGSGRWAERQQIVVNGYTDGALAVGDGVLLAGVPLDDERGDAAGAVYVFRHDGTQWVEDQKIVAADGAADDRFGTTLALAGAEVVVGAYRAEASGAAYVLHDKGGQWEQMQKLVPSDPDPDDRFSSSLSLKGDTLAIGAPQHDEAGFNSGAVYVCRREKGVWVETTRVLTPDGGARDRFGRSVDVDGSVMLVGATGTTGSGSETGSAYLFRYDFKDGWRAERKLEASDAAEYALFGAQVTLDGGNALVASPQDNEAGPGAGAVYVFDADACMCTADLDDNGVIDVDDLTRIFDRWGQTGGVEDIDRSGIVDVRDLLRVLLAWGPCG